MSAPSQNVTWHAFAENVDLVALVKRVLPELDIGLLDANKPSPRHKGNGPPREKNSFFVYKGYRWAQYRKHCKATGEKMCAPKATTRFSDDWKALSAQEQKKWRLAAILQQINHRKANPDYKYNPNRAEQKKSRKRRHVGDKETGRASKKSRPETATDQETRGRMLEPFSILSQPVDGSVSEFYPEPTNEQLLNEFLAIAASNIDVNGVEPLSGSVQLVPESTTLADYPPLENINGETNQFYFAPLGNINVETNQLCSSFNDKSMIVPSNANANANVNVNFNVNFNEFDANNLEVSGPEPLILTPPPDQLYGNFNDIPNTMSAPLIPVTPPPNCVIPPNPVTVNNFNQFFANLNDISNTMSVLSMPVTFPNCMTPPNTNADQVYNNVNDISNTMSVPSLPVTPLLESDKSPTVQSSPDSSMIPPTPQNLSFDINSLGTVASEPSAMLLNDALNGCAVPTFDNYFDFTLCD